MSRGRGSDARDRIVALAAELVHAIFDAVERDDEPSPVPQPRPRRKRVNRVPPPPSGPVDDISRARARKILREQGIR